MTALPAYGITFRSDELKRGNYDQDGNVITGQWRVIGAVEVAPNGDTVLEITDEASYDVLAALSPFDRAVQANMWDGEWWAVPWAGGCFEGGETDAGGITVMGCALLAGHDGDHHIP